MDGKTVYLIKNGKKLGFRNPDEYKSYGYNFSQAVPASAVDKSLPSETAVAKAMEGTLVIDASDGHTVYMIGIGGTKRGFASEAAFKGLGYKFGQLPKIDVSDYPAGPVITSESEPHPEGALVLEGKTVWWVRNGQKTGFESMAVFNTYGFKTSILVKANTADTNLPQGPLVKFRDGTLVKEGNDYYLITDGKKAKFNSVSDLAAQGYQTSNAISASLNGYEADSQVLGATAGEPSVPLNPPRVRVKETSIGFLNVRKGPSTGTALVAKVLPGEIYTYTEVQNGWYQIQMQDMAGWVRGDYVEVVN